jgi:hypothetical protein
MDLGMFSVQQHEEMFEELNNAVAGLFERLQDAEALSACALALVHAASLKQPALANTAMQTAQVLLETCSQQLVSAVDAVGQTSDTQLAVCFQLRADAVGWGGCVAIHLIAAMDDTN